VVRTKHALNVTDAERDRIRELYAQGVRVVDIVKRVKRSVAVVHRAVRDLRRPRPVRARNTERDARMVAMHAAGSTFRELGIAFGISMSRAFDIVSVLTGKRKPRPRTRTTLPSVSSPARRAPRLTRAQRARRNTTIEELWREGVTQATLARRFMLTRARVGQIVAARLRRRRESLPVKPRPNAAKSDS